MRFAAGCLVHPRPIRESRKGASASQSRLSSCDRRQQQTSVAANLPGAQARQAQGFQSYNAGCEHSDPYGPIYTCHTYEAKGKASSSAAFLTSWRRTSPSPGPRCVHATKPAREATTPSGLSTSCCHYTTSPVSSQVSGLNCTCGRTPRSGGLCPSTYNPSKTPPANSCDSSVDNAYTCGPCSALASPSESSLTAAA